ncbi:hypothetical protein [Acetobacter persici]|uniref:hypothetical protein n=1 Tax=Acetobacter persici TaxID=1076596 RepID=UPI001BAA550F|nr:hypothetical protein [Acetobacter persici]MBS1014456.1 hypothetical protein [Acetobacter persici]
MTQPTGVFVRLPLSDTEKMALTSGVKMGGSIADGILAIGTPVTDGELEVVDYSAYEPEYHSEGMGCGLEDRGIHDRYEAMGYGWDQALDRACSEFPEAVLLSDALAKLAEKDAEIAQKDAEIERLKRIAYSGRGSLSHTIHSPARFADEARKGPEA